MRTRTLLGVAILLGWACDASDDRSPDGGTSASSGPHDATSDDAAAEDTADTPPPATSFATQVQPILTASCSCHLSVAGEAGLDLREEVAYANLTAGMSVGGLPLVVPADPDASYFVLKLRGEQTSVAGGSGSQMPLVGELAPGQLETIEAWVAGGAAE